MCEKHGREKQPKHELADVVSYHQRGESNVGIYIYMWAAKDRIGIAGLGLAAQRFPSRQSGEEAEQKAEKELETEWQRKSVTSGGRLGVDAGRGAEAAEQLKVANKHCAAAAEVEEAGANLKGLEGEPQTRAKAVTEAEALLDKTRSDGREAEAARGHNQRHAAVAEDPTPQRVCARRGD